MSLWVAHHRNPKKIILGDVLEPICGLWRAIIDHPEETGRRYEEVWRGQASGDESYFYHIRERYNRDRQPVDLLYIICRCVKNAVRFNKSGKFTQSVDKRRLGMAPSKMILAIMGASSLLRGRAEVRSGDWMTTTSDVGSLDFVYMDPPYLGTSIGKDRRYAEQLASDRLNEGLGALLEKGARFALSYDGSTGGKEYGPPLPAHLGLTRLLLHAGKSSQATLAGRNEETIESLYLSPGLGSETQHVIRSSKTVVPQAEFAL